MYLIHLATFSYLCKENTSFNRRNDLFPSSPPQQGAAALISARTYSDFTTQATFEIKVTLKHHSVSPWCAQRFIQRLFYAEM